MLIRVFKDPFSMLRLLPMNMVVGSFMVASSHLIGIKSDVTDVGLLQKNNEVVACIKKLGQKANFEFLAAFQ